MCSGWAWGVAKIPTSSSVSGRQYGSGSGWYYYNTTLKDRTSPDTEENFGVDDGFRDENMYSLLVLLVFCFHLLFSKIIFCNTPYLNLRYRSSLLH